MTRIVPCSLVLFSIFLTSCSQETPTRVAEGPATGSSSVAPAPVTAAAPVAAAPVSPPPAAAPGPALQSQDTNRPGIAADFTECRRKDGVLNIRIRFRNTSAQETNLWVFAKDHQAYYVTAANKKYFILKDAEGTYLASAADGNGNLEAHLQPGQQYMFWAKFPAPPPDVKKITFMTPMSAPFEDIPITDQ